MKLLRFLKYQFRKVFHAIARKLISLGDNLTDTDLNYHRHSPGDGLHLINDNVQTLENGGERRGDPSDICIVSNAQALCSIYGLPALDLLWSEAYPDDPMSSDDLTTIIESALPYMNECDPLLPEIRDAILQDLRAIRCDDLADNIEQLLRPFTQVERLLDDKKDTLD